MAGVGHVLRLESLRDDLETRLFLREERGCFGDDDVDDGTREDLKVRIRDLSREISALRHCASCSSRNKFSPCRSSAGAFDQKPSRTILPRALPLSITA